MPVPLPDCLLSQRPLACTRPPPHPPPWPLLQSPWHPHCAVVLLRSCPGPHLAGLSLPPARPPDLCICAQSRLDGDSLRCEARRASKVGPSNLCNVVSSGLADEPARVHLTTPSGCCSGAGPCPPPSCPPGCLHSFLEEAPLGGLYQCCPRQALLCTASGLHPPQPPAPSFLPVRACREQLGPSGVGLGPRRPSDDSTPR